MRAEDYQTLMDRGWRRCGEYYYKPDLKKSCCQLNTIRLDAEKFVPNKKQRKIMKRFNRYLLGTYSHEEVKEEIKKDAKDHSLQDKTLNLLNKSIKDTAASLSEYLQTMNITLSDQDINKICFSLVKCKKPNGPDYVSNSIISFCKGDKSKASEISQEFVLNFVKTTKVSKIESSPFGHINIWIDNEKESASLEKLKKDDCNKKLKQKKDAEIEEEDKTSKLEYTKYFDEYFPISKEDLKKNEFKHQYRVEIHRAMAKNDAFEVFKKYEKSIHGKIEKKIEDFGRFLCWSPLYDTRNKKEAYSQLDNKNQKDHDKNREFKNENVYPEFYGSYHMYHIIDDEIFAIGVLDITPNVVSSVYFFYDPKYSFLSPGIIGAIKEIEYVNKIRKEYDENMKYYYMGYYIPDCQKSVYKGEYHPSELLCPITYTWVQLDQTKENIKQQGFCKYADESTECIPQMKITDDEARELAESFFFYYQNFTVILTIEMLNPKYVDQIKETIKEIFKTVGKDLFPKLIFSI